MTFNLPDLDDDPRTRAYMIEEVELDESNDGLYPSPRLTAAGHQAWPTLLRAALIEHDPQWLCTQSNKPAFWRTHETYSRNGNTFSKAVPVNAAEILAEGQFIRYYLRAVARRAVDDNLRLQVVRLKNVVQARPESARLIGSVVDATALLESLRQNHGVTPALGVPAGANSGLGVRLIK